MTPPTISPHPVNPHPGFSLDELCEAEEEGEYLPLLIPSDIAI